jgi:hypothetical protein
MRGAKRRSWRRPVRLGPSATGDWSPQSVAQSERLSTSPRRSPRRACGGRFLCRVSRNSPTVRPGECRDPEAGHRYVPLRFVTDPVLTTYSTFDLGAQTRTADTGQAQSRPTRRACRPCSGAAVSRLRIVSLARGRLRRNPAWVRASRWSGRRTGSLRNWVISGRSIA